MGATLVVHHLCSPKRTLGQGDPTEGTARIRSLLTALRPENAGLDELGRHCEDCPARVIKEPFGCFGYFPYPVRASDEEWMMGRLQSPNSAPGYMLMSAMNELGYDGAPIRAWRRRRDRTERKRAVKRTLVPGSLFRRGLTISSDQVFQAILGSGNLEPAHCGVVLSWLGAIQIDGEPLVRPEQMASLFELTSAERAARSSFSVGQDEPEAIGHLLRCMYRAWVMDLSLLVRSSDDTNEDRA